MPLLVTTMIHSTGRRKQQPRIPPTIEESSSEDDVSAVASSIPSTQPRRPILQIWKARRVAKKAPEPLKHTLLIMFLVVLTILVLQVVLLKRFYWWEEAALQVLTCSLDKCGEPRPTLDYLMEAPDGV